MMKLYSKYLALLGMALIACTEGYPQQSRDHTATAEKLGLLTDRSLYIPGEDILFTVRLLNGKPMGSPEPGRVFYVELISPAGQQVNGGKFRLASQAGHGCLVIPESVSSGYYYLRAYTRAMRNQGPSAYAYEPLVIVNPLVPEFMPGKTGKVGIFHAPEDTLAAATGIAPVVLPEKIIYCPGDEVNIRFGSSGLFPEPVAGWCVSVIPEGSRKPAAPIHPPVSLPVDAGQYFPEHRGISISGRLSEPSVINLSIPAEKEMMAIHSEDDGSFRFSLPGYDGTRDLFLCPAAGQGNKVTVRVDNDFCPEPVRLPDPEFRPDSVELRLALQLARNFAVSKHFNPSDSSGNVLPREPARPFYDAPTELLLMDKYIQLPTLGEYFSELPTPVKVRKKHGKSYFRFMSSQADMTIYDPLVMIDWVAVDDVSEILKLPPQTILRIEFFNAPYVKGNMIYGGIMNFISRQGDFAGVNLPASGIFINYGFFYGEPCKLHCSEVNESVPDSRNTVYWNPFMEAREGQIPHVSFKAPDTPGKYQVLLRGMSPDGQVLERTGSFMVMIK